ncbi:hypothetical protein EUA06_01130 [Nocardioides glacieisoli]|uniref:Uncharacterized protein n=1 Tax=Nocardioides glacieisoli TaxID=1168730 RepID=A0A4Q2S6W1_9ACTN|nr:hypothetical protein [Nocardioides glacieisoli]RYB96215.1 hypothetical protein EUA06_01130 [Nocardioides glacieisoli]
MNDLDLLESARDTRWEHDLPTPHDVRARGNRRTKLRRVSGAAAALVSIAIVYAVVGPMNNRNPDQVAADVPFNAENLNGAEFDLPPGWEVLNRPSVSQVCVGDATEPDTSCPVLMAVANDPQTALENGLDVVADLMSTCQPDDPQFVEVAHDTPGTSTYSGRCTANSPVMTAWSYDNRTLYVLATEVRWRSDGADIFDTITVPSYWPQAPAATESATPGPSTVNE